MLLTTLCTSSRLLVVLIAAFLSTAPQASVSLSPTPTPTLTDKFLRFSDPESLSGAVERIDDTFFGPIHVSEGNGFIFAGEHREIYIGSNGYFTFGRGLTDHNPFNFPQTDYVVAPFWGDIDIRRGGDISFQVYTTFNELDSVNQVIRDVNGDELFNGKWMLVAQWTEVVEIDGDAATVNTFEGILITDGNSTSYAVFIYRCGDINWHGNLAAVVGYRANRDQFQYINPASYSDDVLMLGCNNARTYPWENLIYPLDGNITGAKAPGEFVGECSDNPVKETETLLQQIETFGVCEPYRGLAIQCNPVIEKDVDYVYIPYTRTNGNQDRLSTQLNLAGVIIATLPDECREVARRLLCTYYFIPCGRNDTMFPPQAVCRDECEYISIDLCPDQWQLTLDFFATDQEEFDRTGVSLVNCSNPGEILEPLPHCCTNLGLIPEPTSTPTLTPSGTPTPTPTGPTGTPNSTNSKGTVIIASAVGGGGGGLLIIAVVVVLLVIVCFYRHKHHRHIPDSYEMEGAAATNVYTPPNMMEQDTHQNASEDTRRVPSKYMRQLSAKLLIPHEQLQLLDTLGQGEFGVVYRARWTGFHGERPRRVAVKTLKALFNECDIQQLMEESLIMMKFDHPNVLNLIGVCVDGGPAPLLVVPFMANGSLLKYLKKERPKLSIAEGADSDLIEETQRNLLSMCLQITRGMEYLAELKFVHRDLAARNCMIGKDGVIKVADFGLSEDIYARNYFRQGKEDNGVKLPFKWMALESLQDGVFTEKTDVWSFGVTCWEVFSAGRTPYPGVDPFSLVKFLEEGKRLDKPSNAACSDEVYNFLMLHCWSVSVDERPEFSELVKQISTILEAVAGYVDFSNLPQIRDSGESGYDVIDPHQEGGDDSCMESIALN